MSAASVFQQISLQVWVTLGAILGVTQPATFDFLTADLFTYCLGFLMLSMGLTLTVDDFKEVWI